MVEGILSVHVMSRLTVHAVVGARAGLDLLNASKDVSDELRIVFSTLLGRMSSLSLVIESLETIWGNERVMGAAGTVRSEIASKTEQFRAANAAVIERERNRADSVRTVGGALAGWATAVGAIAVGSVVGAGSLGSLGGALRVLAGKMGLVDDVVPEEVEEAANAVREIWTSALRESESILDGSGAEKRLELVLHLVVASLEGAGRVCSGWLERWEARARQASVVRTLTVFGEAEIRAKMDAQVQAAEAALVEARSELEAAVAMYLAEQRGKDLSAMRSEIDKMPETVTTALRHALQSEGLVSPGTAATGVPAAAVVSLRTMAARMALAAERSEESGRGKDAGVLRILAANRDNTDMEPPLGFVPTRVYGVGAEGAVLECTTSLTGNSLAVAVKVVPNESGRRSSSLRGPDDPYAHEYKAYERLSDLRTHPTNVLRLLATFVGRPSEEMLEKVMESSSYPKDQMDKLLRDGNDDPWPMRMVVLPLCRGGDLHEFLKATKRRARRDGREGIPYVLVTSILRGIADGLVQLRAAGMVHMDSKLGNVLVDVDTGVDGPAKYIDRDGVERVTPRVVIADLGAVRTAPSVDGEEVDLSHVTADIRVPASLDELRSLGRSDAEDVDAAYKWSGVRDSARYRGVRGNLDCRSPEVLAGGSKGPWDLKRQSAFELGVLMWEILTAKHPVENYAGDDTTPGIRTVREQDLAVDIQPEMGKIANVTAAAADDFAEIVTTAKALLHPDPEQRMALEEARAVLWWAWERSIAREQGTLVDEAGAEGWKLQTSAERRNPLGAWISRSHRERGGEEEEGDQDSSILRGGGEKGDQDSSILRGGGEKGDQDSSILRGGGKKDGKTVQNGGGNDQTLFSGEETRGPSFTGGASGEQTVHVSGPLRSSGSSLLEAARVGDVERVVREVAAGANVDEMGLDRRTAVHWAAVNGLGKAMEDLVRAGALLDGADSEGWTPLLLAAKGGNPKCVYELLQGSAQIHHVHPLTQQTPLHVAAQCDHGPIVRVLLDAGALPDTRDCDWKTPRDCATPAIAAWFDSAVEEARGKLRQKADGGSTINFFRGAFEGDMACVRAHIALGTDVNIRSNTGETAILAAACSGHHSVVRTLLSAGADPNVQNAEGLGPLHMAAANRHTLVVQILLRFGASPTAKNSKGCTPLHLAAQNGFQDIVQIILSTSTDPNPTDNDGWTPLHWAAGNGKLTVVDTLLQTGAHVAATTNSKWTALHFAAEGGYEAVVRALLAAGALVDAQNNSKETPLSRAAENGRDPVIRTLLWAGADANAKDANGRTPLDRAQAQRKISSVTILREAGGVSGSCCCTIS